MKNVELASLAGSMVIEIVDHTAHCISGARGRCECLDPAVL